MWWFAIASSMAQSGIDAMEHVFGATNVAAVTGHGRLTLGVSAQGDVTVLAWPNPSLADQLAYQTSNAVDAREKPRFGAPESAGVALALWIEPQSKLVWLRDLETTLGYGETDGPNPTTVHVDAELGLEVEVVDAVSPATDTWVRRVTVTRDATSPVEEARLLSYLNLSPQPPGAQLEELPVTDWLFDGRNDYAALWDASNGTAVHFHPTGGRVYPSLVSLLTGPTVTWGPLDAAFTSGTVDAAELLASADVSGAVAVVGTVPASEAHQIGYDSTDWCGQTDGFVDNLQALPEVYPEFELPLDPAVLNPLRCADDAVSVPDAEGWTHAAADPMEDLKDGVLEGSDAAAGEVAVALATPLAFDGDVATASLVVGFGGTHAEASSAFEAGSDPDAVIEDAEATVSSWLDTLRIPGDGEVRRIAKRALVNIRVGTVDNGAIVASIARQPPYGLDWPRDGCFFDLLLDASGQSDLVATRTALYADWQRKEPGLATPLVDPTPPDDPDVGEVDSYPAGGWEMNYYPDGRAGGNLRFEIDTTAFAVWTMVAHAGWEEAPEEYLRERWEAIRLGNDLLARWRDAENGLQAPAQEDDHVEYTQSLHGAVTVFGALDLGARAARLIGEEEDAEAWETRARELQRAILDELYDEDAGRFVSTSEELGSPSASSPLGPSAWLVWPMTLLSEDDPRLVDQIAYDAEIIAPTLALEDAGGAYFMKNTLAAAMWGELDDGVLEALAAQATSTGHFGEVMVVADGQADQRVATPHLWEGALFALTALADEDPEALRAFDSVFPPSRVREDQITLAHDESRRCGCGGHGGVPHSWAFLLIVIAVRRTRLGTFPTSMETR